MGSNPTLSATKIDDERGLWPRFSFGRAGQGAWTGPLGSLAASLGLGEASGERCDLAMNKKDRELQQSMKLSKKFYRCASIVMSVVRHHFIPAHR